MRAAAGVKPATIWEGAVGTPAAAPDDVPGSPRKEST
jgi:hypothetical protein